MKKMEYFSIFKEQGITKILFNELLSKTNNDYKLEKLQQKYMESKEIK
jgi:deoxycytidine triphosphate deaminase